MPKRPGVVLIILFWLTTVSYIVYRDVLPQLFGDSAPRVWIDLSDEATQAIPIRWTMYRNGAQFGRVSTNMSFDAGTELFQYSTKYRELNIELETVKCTIPELEITTAVNRAGQLRAQGIKLQVQAKLKGIEIGSAHGIIESVVHENVLVGNCRLTSTLFPPIEQPLEPTPVPDGQVINPMQPVNRLRGVQPGMRFVIYEINPLGDALKIIEEAVIKKYLQTTLFKSKPTERKSLIATVGDRPEALERKSGPVDCWVIDFRSDSGTSKVWVRVSDGQVLQQLASVSGETLRRED
jgi:hypothetical protein